MFGNWRQRSGAKRSASRSLGGNDRWHLGLRLESLEQRAMLSATTSTDPSQGSPVATDAATHLEIFAPPMALAGTIVPIEVVALDANNQPTSAFSDEISLSSSDTSAVVSVPGASAATGGTAVPFDYTFSSSNDGHQLFLVTFGTSGAQSLTVSDTTDSSVTAGTTNTTVSTPAAATHLAVIISPNVIAGAPANVLVEALDANNHPVPNYTGTIILSSSDSTATLGSDDALPQTYTFTSSDHGRHQFQVTFGTSGSQTVTADDTADSLTGTGTTNVNAARVATHFAVWVPPTALAGVPTNVTVLALDANNHPVPNYTGTVALSSSDSSATLPASYTFQASDHGLATVQATFATDGPQTVTATDTNNITGTATTNVVPAPVATQFLVVLPPSAPAGVPVQGFIVALSADGRPVPDYTGTISFASSDANATLPVNYTFQQSDHGFYPFTVTFATTGSQSVTATDTTSNISGTASTTVTAAQVPTSLRIDVPQNAAVGAPIVIKIDVLDANGNPIQGFAGPLTLTTSDSAATIVPLASVLPGGLASNLYLVAFGTSGSQTLTATDSTDSLTADVNVNVRQGLGGIFGPSAPIISNPAPPPPKGPGGSSAVA